jgi:hypothetical protein
LQAPLNFSIFTYPFITKLRSRLSVPFQYYKQAHPWTLNKIGGCLMQSGSLPEFKDQQGYTPLSDTQSRHLKCLGLKMSSKSIFFKLLDFVRLLFWLYMFNKRTLAVKASISIKAVFAF